MVKDNVLRILEENRGRLVSGEELGRSMGVSRTAVWKAVSNLKEDGFDIGIKRSAGYSLGENCDKLSEFGIERYLHTKTMGRQLILLNSAASTNSYLRTLADKDALGGVTVVAESQTSGRGRFGRSFYSPSGGIYMSVLIRPENSLLASWLTIIAAVSAAGAVDECCGAACSLKWVNDVYLGGKKICGILTEGAIEAETAAYRYLITGIGINVRTPQNGFPAELKEKAASVEEFSVKPFTRNMIIAGILNRIEDYCLSITSEKTRWDLIESYKKRLFMLQKAITVHASSGDYKAFAMDISESGNLIVRKEDGTVTSIAAGEISVSV